MFRGEAMVGVIAVERMARPLRFALVGVFGFLVDVAVLYAMLAIGFDHVSGRLASFVTAVTLTWYLNRRFTFSDFASPNFFAEWVKFVTANLGGASINILVYLAIMSLDFATSIIVAIAVAIGSLSGMAFNYTTSWTLVFRGMAAESSKQTKR